MKKNIPILDILYGAQWVLPFILLIMFAFLPGCSSQVLKPWHRVKLTAEFDAGMTDEVSSFEEYLQLEDRLFEQLENEVYTETGSGSEFDIIRYSHGSLSDPQHRTPN